MASWNTMWTGYLDSTLLTRRRAAAIVAPAAAFGIAAITVWDLSWIQVLLLTWAWAHLVNAVLVVRHPAAFGLRLWFPPLEARGRAGDQTALLAARMLLLCDLMYGTVRALFGLFPSSAVLFALVLLTAALQIASFEMELRAGNTDVRARYIGRAGAAILAVAAITHAALGGVDWSG
jgi:hypothetical protein